MKHIFEDLHKDAELFYFILLFVDIMNTINMIIILRH